MMVRPQPLARGLVTIFVVAVAMNYAWGIARTPLNSVCGRDSPAPR